MKSGWKTDFDNNGKIELVTEIDCMVLLILFTVTPIVVHL